MDAAPNIKLTGATLYLPGGQVKHFKPGEVAGYADTTIVTVDPSDRSKLTRYVGFPMVIHLETSAISVVGPGAVPSILT